MGDSSNKKPPHSTSMKDARLENQLSAFNKPPRKPLKGGGLRPVEFAIRLLQDLEALRGICGGMDGSMRGDGREFGDRMPATITQPLAPDLVMPHKGEKSFTPPELIHQSSAYLFNSSLITPWRYKSTKASTTRGSKAVFLSCTIFSKASSSLQAFL